ncbi:MAG: type II toxin-antitoxin system VapB family antitoxin [Ignavibacteriaceae bacterium]
MATNLALDDRLIEEAQMIGKHKTKKETVTEALREYISYRKQKEIKTLFHKVEYEAKSDYKKQRNVK